MWLCTKFGFFSIVRKVDARQGDPAFPIQVRARSLEDLKSLVSACPALGGTRIIATPHADYCGRIVISEAQLSGLMSALAASLDYGNFKDAIHSIPAQAGKLPEYSKFWSLMNSWQDRN